MYYENFEKLCILNNVKPNKVSQDTGISTATLSSWKKGKYTPKNEKLQIIADYFNVSLDYITTGKKSEIPLLKFNDDSVYEMIEIYEKLNKEQKSAVLNLLRSFAQ